MDDYADITVADIDFRVYYEIEENEMNIGGIYLYGSHIDLIDVIDEEVKEDMKDEINNPEWED